MKYIHDRQLPDKAIDIALDKRFITKGRLDSKGNVVNYEDRFQYGEDMLDSGPMYSSAAARTAFRAVPGLRG